MKTANCKRVRFAMQITLEVQRDLLVNGLKCLQTEGRIAADGVDFELLRDGQEIQFPARVVEVSSGRPAGRPFIVSSRASQLDMQTFRVVPTWETALALAGRSWRSYGYMYYPREKLLVNRFCVNGPGQAAIRQLGRTGLRVETGMAGLGPIITITRSGDVQLTL